MKVSRLKLLAATSALTTALSIGLVTPAPAAACSHDDAPLCEEINDGVSKVGSAVGTAVQTAQAVLNAVCSTPPDPCNIGNN